MFNILDSGTGQMIRGITGKIFPSVGDMRPNCSYTAKKADMVDSAEEVDDIDEALRENGYATVYLSKNNKGQDIIVAGYFTTDSKKPDITSPLSDFMNRDGVTIDWDRAAEILRNRLEALNRSTSATRPDYSSDDDWDFSHIDDQQY